MSSEEDGEFGGQNELPLEEYVICLLNLIDKPLTAEELSICTGHPLLRVKQQLEYLFFEDMIGSSIRSSQPYTIEYFPKSSQHPLRFR